MHNLKKKSYVLTFFGEKVSVGYSCKRYHH